MFKKPASNTVLAAIFMMLASVFFVQVMNASAKAASAFHDPVTIVFYRGIISLAPLLAWMIWTRNFQLLKTDRPFSHFGRSLLGNTNICLLFWSFSLMPMAEASALMLTSGLVLTALSGPMLGEKVGIWRWSAVIIGFMGALIVTQPGDGHIAPLAACVAMAGAVTSAFVTIYLRSLGKTEHAFTTVFYFVVFGTVVSGIYMIFKGTPPHPSAWALLLATGLASLFLQLLRTEAYKIAEASVLTPFQYTSLLWAVIFGYMFWGTVPDPVFWLGAGLIVAANLTIIGREIYLKRPLAVNKNLPE